jgi:hypothetical protein
MQDAVRQDQNVEHRARSPPVLVSGTGGRHRRLPDLKEHSQAAAIEALAHTRLGNIFLARNNLWEARRK